MPQPNRVQRRRNQVIAPYIGVSRPLRRIPAIVSFLNPQPAFARQARRMFA
jgi:hypothetical protein